MLTQDQPFVFLAYITDSRKKKGSKLLKTLQQDIDNLWHPQSPITIAREAVQGIPTAQELLFDSQALPNLHALHFASEVQDSSTTFLNAPAGKKAQINWEEIFLDHLPNIRWAFLDGGSSHQLAESLLFAGVPIVIGIRGLEDQADAWQAFRHGLYQALAQSQPLVEALETASQQAQVAVKTRIIPSDPYEYWDLKEQLIQESEDGIQVYVLDSKTAQLDQPWEVNPVIELEEHEPEEEEMIASPPPTTLETQDENLAELGIQPDVQPELEESGIHQLAEVSSEEYDLASTDETEVAEPSSSDLEDFSETFDSVESPEMMEDSVEEVIEEKLIPALETESYASETERKGPEFETEETEISDVPKDDIALEEIPVVESSQENEEVQQVELIIKEEETSDDSEEVETISPEPELEETIPQDIQSEIQEEQPSEEIEVEEEPHEDALMEAKEEEQQEFQAEPVIAEEVEIQVKDPQPVNFAEDTPQLETHIPEAEIIEEVPESPQVVNEEEAVQANPASFQEAQSEDTKIFSVDQAWLMLEMDTARKRETKATSIQTETWLESGLYEPFQPEPEPQSESNSSQFEFDQEEDDEYYHAPVVEPKKVRPWRRVLPLSGVTMLICLGAFFLLSYTNKEPVPVEQPKVVNPFENAEAYKILLLPLKHYPNCTAENAYLEMAIRDRILNAPESQELNVQIKFLTQGSCPSNSEEAKNIGKFYNANMVVWGDYTKESNDQRSYLKYVVLDEEFKRSHLNLSSIGHDAFQDIYQLKEGQFSGSENAIMHWLFACLYLQHENYVQSKSHLDMANDKNDEEPGYEESLSLLYHLRAKCFEGLKQPDEELDSYNKALFLNDRDAHAYHKRAELYERMERPELALNDYAQAISHNPNHLLAIEKRRKLINRRLKKSYSTVQ
ncbi:hypothetical protein [Pontibacter sp. G13]|uniref:CHAT domain-containing tetratricopeptide repeat protein n=1 Tax=Pontibacter sp. G13 TaxID=3074898 RepID=UPI00288BEA29|nr:hypothetical protein [Pontibacter sp. G13]WNJ21502.1 hypothetical protein RJD25_13615 [Pontibacter sp. G13]